MTKYKKRSEKAKKERYISILSSTAVILTAVLIGFLLSPYISKHVRYGLNLCYESIIGSVFPFMILSDIVFNFSRTEEIGILRKAFERLFKINGRAVGVFVVGILCGFPLGAKCARTLYDSGEVTKEECERLIGFTNNASPSFVISGIGYLIRGSIIDGMILYFSSTLASVALGMLLGIKKEASDTSHFSYISNFDFALSVKNASVGTLNICGFVTLFSVILGIINDFLRDKTILISTAIFLEIGNASKLLSSISVSPDISLILTSFAISFSGLSVYMQVRSFFSESDISTKKYLFAKLMQGLISALVTALILLTI